MLKMNYYLDQLFQEQEHLEAPAENVQHRDSSPVEVPFLSLDTGSVNGDDGEDDDILSGLGRIMGDCELISNEDQIANQCNSPLETLMQQRDEWKQKADIYEAKVEALQKRANAALKVDQTIEVTHRINYLERQNQRLQAELAELKERAGHAERENRVLENDNDGKSKKLKGANKKVVKAKSVANKEEEKAKTAVNDKNLRLAAERKMRKERNDALAELEKHKKLANDLRAQLKVEQSGHARIRDDGSNSDDVVAVVPVEFDINRMDFNKLQSVFESNQIKMRDGFKQYYAQWKKSMKEKATVVGANYADDSNRKIRIGLTLDDDDVEYYDDQDYMPSTGAEHNGRRSKRGLEAICRQAQSAYNSHAI